MIKITIAIGLSYLLGSIPFGAIVARQHKIDIQKVGSGNIGATNVFRTLGTAAGSLVFVLDLLKGTLATWLAMQILASPFPIILAASFAVVGHLFPVFLKFKGGRGSATGLGILLAISPEIFICAVVFAAIIIWFTRYVSLASISVPPLVTLAMFLMQQPAPYSIATGIISILIILKHIPNIQRLLAGTERKIGSTNRG